MRYHDMSLLVIHMDETLGDITVRFFIDALTT
jgi:hypothetical protein